MILNVDTSTILEEAKITLAEKKKIGKTENKTDDKFNPSERFSDSEIRGELKDMKEASTGQSKVSESLSAIIDFISGGK